MADKLIGWSQTQPERRMSPDRRKKGATELEQQLTAHAERIESRLHRFFSKSLAIFAVLGIISAGSLLGFGLLLRKESGTSNKIQAQRREFVRTACLSQNKRNRETKAQLISAAAKDEAKRTTERSKAEVRRRRDVTLALIDALAPFQNCGRAVVEATGGSS